MKKTLYDRFLNNIEPFKNKIQIIKSYSYDGLILLNHLGSKEIFDIIYIDASHMSKDVIGDALLSFPLLKVGGVMIFDDYDLNIEPNNTKLGVDCFLASHRLYFNVDYIGEQVFITKKYSLSQTAVDILKNN